MQIHRYEHPLNEKVRIYLRLEHLLKQLHDSSALSDPWQYTIFFNALFDLLELIEQIPVKTDLAKALDKQSTKLKAWLDYDGVDPTAIQSLLDSMSHAQKNLLAAPRLGQSLREDRFLSSIRQRFSIPGGTCSFDLPALHFWRQLPLEERQQTTQAWLDQLAEIDQALGLWLHLVRQSAQYQPQSAHNGFFQNDASLSCLLRIKIDASYGVYPVVSGHRSHFSIRFSPYEEGSTVASNIDFKLAIC